MKLNALLGSILLTVVHITLIFSQIDSTGVAQVDSSVIPQDSLTAPADSVLPDTTAREQIEKPELKLADIVDGSRAVPVHLLKIFDDEGQQIFPDQFPMMPFSSKQTCQECHTYEKIASGLHFNYTNPDAPPGRKGEPWILYDQISGTQLPISFRPWPGTYHPEEVGLTHFSFTQTFGRHFPGGATGELSEDDPPDLFNRWLVSGQLEINCLSCHNAHPAHDQAEFATNVSRENFRWAMAASSGLAVGEGSARNMPDNYDIYLGMDPNNPRAIPPGIEYHESVFDSKNRILFNIKRDIPSDRCYFCHSTSYIRGGVSEKWQMDEDVHMLAGMTCVDCHRNGLDHMMIRGYEGEFLEINNPTTASFTCKGCHIGNEYDEIPQAGRLGAPYPEHKGIPAMHFDVLSCTACHSGPWPSKSTVNVKTSRANALGTHTVNRNAEAIPRLVAPVYVKEASGKIEPHKLIWPSFWSEIKGDTLKPLDLELVREVILDVLAADTLTDSLNYKKILEGSWPDITEEKIKAILSGFSENGFNPGYVGGGKLFTINNKTLLSEEHPAAKPYSWAIAHDVRPASQSLGVRSCGDCHDNDAAFHFGKVTIQTPLSFVEGQQKTMTNFMDVNTMYARVFSFTFLFRPWLKALIFFCCFIIAGMILLYGLKGLDAISQSIGPKK